MLTATLKAKPQHSFEELRQTFHYAPETGVLTWARSIQRTATKGAPAGTAHSGGYRTVGYQGRQYFVHRLAWLLVHGEWPSGVIDHINGDPADNRIANLRDVDGAANAQNLKKAHADSQTGFLGVRKNGDGIFAARIWAKGKSISLGNFRSAKAAHEAYLQAKRTLHDGGTL